MSDNKTNDKTKISRRKALKSTALGAGVVGAGVAAPKEWTKPSMGAVTLPAHASATNRRLSSNTLNSGKLDYS